MLAFYTGVFLVYNDTVLEENSTSLSERDIQTVHCYSDNKNTSIHEWTFPNNSKVPRKEGPVVAIRDGDSLVLTRVGNNILPAGQYCCRAQDARNNQHTLCVQVNKKPGKRDHMSIFLYTLMSCSHSTEVAAVGVAVVGGAVAAIVILLVIILIIIVAIILYK